MKSFFLALLILASVKEICAQSISNKIVVSLVGKKDKFVKVQVLGGSAYVEGYEGDDLIFEPVSVDGLNASSDTPTGMTNITGLSTKFPSPAINAPNPRVSEDELAMLLIFRQSNQNVVRIKVPSSVHFRIALSNPSPDAKLSVKDLTGELEVSSDAPITEISNTSGPLLFGSSGANVGKLVRISNINWDKLALNSSKRKFWILGAFGDIDISLPENLKATLDIVNKSGNVYSDFKLTPNSQGPAKNEKNSIISDINGGGLTIMLRTETGNMYIRKQK